MTPGSGSPESNSGRIGGRRALSPLRHPYYSKTPWYNILNTETSTSDKYIQYGWCRKEALPSKVLRVLEHKKEVKVSNKDTNKLHDTTRKNNNMLNYPSMQQRVSYRLISLAQRGIINGWNFTRRQKIGIILKVHVHV